APSPGSVTVADVTGDGRLDLVTVSPLDRAVRVFQNLGGLSFSAQVPFAPAQRPTFERPTLVRVAPLAAAPSLFFLDGQASPTPFLHFAQNNGLAAVGSATQLDASSGGPGLQFATTFALGDLDGDGTADAVVGHGAN